MSRAAHLLAVALLATGCSTASTTTYNAADVGQPIETAEGTVVSSRVVDIAGESSGAGPIAGGAVGATGIGIALGNGAASTLGAVLGGLVGAGIGYLAESRMRSGDGIEYVVQMADGRTMTLVQNREDSEPPLSNGTPVLVQMGAYYSRVIENPRVDRAAAGAGAVDWVNPDTLPPPSSAATPPPVGSEAVDPSQQQQQ